MNPRFSIIATVYNKDLESLSTFLEALTKQTVQEFELVLVDDCSDIDYQEVLDVYRSRMPLSYIRFGTNKGQCHARNVGIRESKGGVVCIVDSDCIPGRRFVEGHLGEHLGNSVSDVVIGPFNIESSGRPIWALLDELQADSSRLEAEMGLQYPENPSYFLNFITRNVSVKRSALPELLFDEDFSYKGGDPQSGFGWEDIEAGYRLFKAGLHFSFAKSAFTVHLTHPPTTDGRLKPLRSFRNFSKLTLKHPQLFNTQALGWILKTYEAIYKWTVNTHRNAPLTFQDRTPKWASVVLILTVRNEKLHPYVIESILSQHIPGVDVYLVLNRQHTSPIADYYAKLHDYVHVVKTNNPQSLVGGIQTKATIWLKDDQLCDRGLIDDAQELAVDSLKGRPQTQQVIRQGNKPDMGGFQSPEQFFARNLSPVLRGNTHKVPRRRLKILTYRWHIGHQYELYKLPHDFYLAEDDTTMPWDFNARPVHSNVRFVKYDQVDPKDFDLAILHFDENCINPSISNGVLNPGWGAIFRRFLNEVTGIPRVGICHGTPPFHGMFNVDYQGPSLMKEWKAEADRIRRAVGDMPVVVNSWNAWDQWKFPNSRVIWHGLDSSEYSVGIRKGGMVYVANSIRYRPWYRGYFDFKYLSDRFNIHYLGRDDLNEFRKVTVVEPSKKLGQNQYAKQKFQNYLDLVGRHQVFVNTTLRSPMPRSRSEAMLKGLVAVTMDYHDEGQWITNGVNGFLGKTKEELESHLSWILAHPQQVARIGMRGRETIRRVFPLTRYHKEWQENIVDLLGGDV